MREARLSVALFLGLVLLGAVCPHQAFADTFVVLPDGSGDFPTIQAAIVAATEGDIVELGDGTFTGDGNYDIDFLGKAITVRSVSGDPDACVIRCYGLSNYRGFLFQSGEGPSSVLEGVTITEAWGIGRGGGVYCIDSSPTLTNVTFLNNEVNIPFLGLEGGGAGLFSSGGSPTLTGVTFRDNWVGGASYTEPRGGGMYCVGGFPTLTDVVFIGNQVVASLPWLTSGGGLYCASSATVSGAVFSGNFAGDPGHGGGEGGGLYCDGSATFEDVMFTENSPNAVTVGYFCSPALSHATFLRCTKGLTLLGSGVVLTNATFWRNRDYAISCESAVEIRNCIIADTRIGPGVAGSGAVTISCCDVYGNAGGDWVGCIAGQHGVNGNISLHALFCNPWNGDFTLHDNSPCAPYEPPNTECDLIGAWPVGCGPSATEATSWGSIKAMYR